VLGQIPFGILLRSSSETTNANAPFLIKQFAISHVPNLSAWLAVKKLSETKRANESLIAWGDPAFSFQSQQPPSAMTDIRHIGLTRTSLNEKPNQVIAKVAVRYADIPPLPETREELVAIATTLQADPIKDLHLGADASRASVLQSNSTGELVRKKVVAFATHGLMAGDLPNLKQPALALAITDDAAQNPLDPLLSLEDVLGMRLNADWVILSACNTAAADGKADEALSGLARGFFYAGSRSLLVTHWAVESESAKELTTNTMKNYMANPMQRKAESLRQAMLTVMAMPQYQHPTYWAPYALVGDGGR
jgi:CHAT domain-containing protein